MEVARLRPALHSDAGAALIAFTSAFEKAFGKRIVWVDTLGTTDLPWLAAIDTDRSNTIYLQLRAPGNALALVGHE
jgi:hypothetical protein